MSTDWVWMPHAGHLIVSKQCQFHLNTYVPSGYIVSTVGEYVPDSSVQLILARCRGIELEGQGDARQADWMRKNGYEEIGCDRTYETMVFKAAEAEHKCCPFRQSGDGGLDMSPYNDADAATKGHQDMCEKWSKMEEPPV